jgi:hypothetical protein
MMTTALSVSLVGGLKGRVCLCVPARQVSYHRTQATLHWQESAIVRYPQLCSEYILCSWFDRLTTGAFTLRERKK